MKNLILKLTGILSLFFALSLSLNAQEYLDDSSKWYAAHANWAPMDTETVIYSARKIEVVGDTIIGDYSYKKLLQRTSSKQVTFEIDGMTETYLPIEFFSTVLREESKKFYSYYSGQDRLLFDFDLEIGDVVWDDYGNQVSVESIDSILLGNEYIKVFHLDNYRKIYEGIGSSNGLFWGLGYIGDEEFSGIICHSKGNQSLSFEFGGTPFHPWLLEFEPCDEFFIPGINDADGDGYNSNEECDDNNADVNPEAEEIADNEIDEDCDGADLIISNNEEIENNLSIQILPNPIVNDFYITSDLQIQGNLIVYNSNGKIIMTRKVALNNFGIRIDSSTLPTGLYYIQIKSKDFEVLESTKLLKISN